MAEERVEDERPRLLDDDVDVPDHEERPDLPPLAPLAGELDGEVDDLLERAPALLGAAGRLADRAEGRVQHLLTAVQVHPQSPNEPVAL